MSSLTHDDIIKWKHYWPFVRGIHQSQVDSSHKGQWRRALMLSLICTWTNGWANNWDTSNLRCYHAHYDVTVMFEIVPLCLGLHCALIMIIMTHFCDQTKHKLHKYSLLMQLKAPRNFYWMSNMFLGVEIFLFFVCYHVVPKRHSQLDYELNGL